MQERVKKTKKAVNLSINAELLDAAKAAGTNLSALLERALLDAFKEQRWQTWREENKEATESMNRYIEEKGLPLRKYRTW
jgi:antitoxin CcdA